MAEARKEHRNVKDTGATISGGAFRSGAADGIAGGAYAGGQFPADVTKDLNRLLRGELAATDTYRQALEKLRDESGRDGPFQQLEQMRADHAEATNTLRSLVQQTGAKPPDDAGAWGTWSSAVMGAARILGDKTALSALLSGERSGIDDYQEALKQDHTPDQLRHLYRSQLARNQEHVQQLEALIATI